MNSLVLSKYMTTDNSTCNKVITITQVNSFTTVSMHLSLFMAPQHPKKATRNTNPPPAMRA